MILLAALRGVPQELRTSAKMDGAGFWRRTWQRDAADGQSPAVLRHHGEHDRGPADLHRGVHRVLRLREREVQNDAACSTSSTCSSRRSSSSTWATPRRWRGAVPRRHDRHGGATHRVAAGRLLRGDGDRRRRRAPAGGLGAPPRSATARPAATASTRPRWSSSAATAAARPGWAGCSTWVALALVSLVFVYPFVWLRQRLLQAAGRGLRQPPRPQDVHVDNYVPAGRRRRSRCG